MTAKENEPQEGRVPIGSFEQKERRPSAAAIRDLTLNAVKRQLKGLGCTAYEIGVFHRSQGKMLIRSWQIDQIIKNLPQLKRENARGADIFYRPSGSVNQGIILLDDLNSFQIIRLEKQGFKAAVVVETSPQNFQAWIRVSTTPLSKGVATQAAKQLAKEFQADPNSADWRHFGRLVGFTNKKPQHIDSNGMSPWILLHSYWGKIAPKGRTLIQEAEKLSPQTKKVAIPQQSDHPSPFSPIETFQRLFQHFAKQYGDQADYSRIDWAVVKIMVKKEFSPQEIAMGLRKGSPNIEARKAGHLDDYINRTIQKATKGS